MKQILVLFGGCSPEYSVSLASAYGVLTHMDRSLYQPIPVGITREGAWRWYGGALEAIPEDRWQEEPACLPCTIRLDRGGAALLLLDGSGRTLAFDGAFPLIHGSNGEDGTLQGLFELAGVPLIGCGTLSSALCMDKDRSHSLAALAGVSSPKGLVFAAGADRADIQAAADTLGYPLFVKPVRSGSSFGISRVTQPAGLLPAVEEAFGHDREVLLEEAVDGFEVGCAVLGNEEPTLGRVDEIELSGGFFDFTEKYTLKTSAIHCPARISPEKAQEIQQAAKTVYRALDCRGFARVDLFLTAGGQVLFNEVNTIPGFTAHSRYPNMMKAAGLDFTSLVELQARTLEDGMPRIRPHSQHMCTYLSAVVLCDQADPDALAQLQKLKKHRDFKLSLHGWMEFRIAAVDLSTGDIATNRSGKDLGKSLSGLVAREIQKFKLRRGET